MIVIIGSGPAGISAAIYIKRANIPVMIITNHKSSLVKAKSVENYYGTGKISGENLYYQGIASALELDIPIIEDEAVGISVEKGMSIEGIKDNYSCDAIVLATGSSVSKNYIPGVSSLEGKGVSFCATCDGYFFKNKKLIVIGNGEYANHEYEYLKNISPDITLLNPDNIKSVTGIDKVEGLILNDDTEILADGIFIADNPDSSVLARKTGIIEKDGHIATNEQMETNIPGIFVCGDITPGPKQIAKAVYEGMIAGNSAISFYKEKKKD